MKTMAFNYSEVYISCDQITNYIHSIDGYEYCFTLFSQLNRESNNRYLIDYDVNIKFNLKSLFYIQPKFKYDYFLLHLHNRKQKIKHSLQNGLIVINKNKFQKALFSYAKTIIKLLPKPYKHISLCVDYRLSEYESRYDCLSKCKLNYYINQQEIYPNNYLGYNLNNYYFKHSQNKNIEMKLANICDLFCGYNDDCYKEYYNIYQENLRDNKPFQLWLKPPSFPNTVITHSPKIEFQEFLCYISSIISLRFGFSFIMLTDLFVFIYKNFHQYIYRANNVIINNQINLKFYQHFKPKILSIICDKIKTIP